MDRKRGQSVVDELMSERAVAVLRADDGSTAVGAAEAILAGGIRAIEVTMTVPDAYAAMRRLSRDTAALLGAGTVVTADQVDRCAEAGARFIVSPGCCPEVIERTKRAGLVAIPGALTPTEVLTAWNHGADLVKVFPAARMGPAYLKDLRGPFPGIPLVPTGGITGENAAAYLEAGAALLCFGSWLADRQSLAARQFEQLTERTRQIRRLIERYEEDDHG